MADDRHRRAGAPILVVIAALALVAATLLGAPTPAAAATDRSWTGAVSASWSDGRNWAGGVAPTTGDSVTFTGTDLVSTYDLGSGTSLSGITGVGSTFTSGANRLTLTGPVRALPRPSGGSCGVGLSFPVDLDADVDLHAEGVCTLAVGTLGLRTRTARLTGSGHVWVGATGPGRVEVARSTDEPTTSAWVEGKLGAPDVAQAGGVTEVSGTVGMVTVTAGTVVGAGQMDGFDGVGGSSIAAQPADGAWRVAGVARFGAGHRLVAGIDHRSGTGNPLRVSGAVQIDGAVLDLNQVPFEVPVGRVLTVIDNAGTLPVSGAFRDLPEGAYIQTPANVLRISYRGGDGNDVVLVATDAGYTLATADGWLASFGARRPGGDPGRLDRPVVGLAVTASKRGTWTASSDGGVFAHGDAGFFGSLGGVRLNRPIVGMAGTVTGGGYWLVASDGGIFSFGDARFLGSTGDIRLNQPIVGMAATPTGGGYWLVASDGGIFSFGDARFLGSTGDIRLNQPVVGMAALSTGDGYWLGAADGGVFTFGTAPFLGARGGDAIARRYVGIAS